jgi:hypothetical protein
VLCGKSVASKTKFFRTTGSGEIYYWRNLEALGPWLSVLYSISEIDALLLEWTREMMRPGPNDRPTVETLVTQVSKVQGGSIHYIGSCCYEDPASDNTSWEGLIAGMMSSKLPNQ